MKKRLLIILFLVVAKTLNGQNGTVADSLNQLVVTATRTPKLLKEVPIVTRVISKHDIERSDVANIGDLLQSELPGVELSYGMNQQVSLKIQGFGGNSILFLVDGERLAGETLDNVDYSRLNLDNVQRIEIVKGAASSLYGSNAIGGVVNIITKEADDPFSVVLNGHYGAHNEQRYGGSLGVKRGKLNSIFNVQYASTDVIDLSEGTGDVDVGDYSIIYGTSSLNVKEKLVFNVKDNLKLTGRAGFFRRERNISPQQDERYRSFTSGVKGNWNLAPGKDMELAYSFDQYDKSDYLPFNGLDVRDYSNVQHVVRGIYNHTIAGGHILTVGSEYMRDYLMSYQFSESGSHVQHTADAYAQFDWNPCSQFNLVAGARLDCYSESDLYRVTPKLGLMYKEGNCSLRASYAGGFKAPTLKEMYMDFFMGNVFMIYGNPDLAPEESHNFSLSTEYMRGENALVITGFYNIVDNRITTAWDKSRGGQVYTNMNRIYVSGVDASASGRYDCGISWRLSYAYTSEKIRKGEPRLASTRPHTATVRISYERDWNRYGFNLALQGRYMSRLVADVYTDMTSYEETIEETYPAYSIWKLSLLQRVGSHLSITLALDNLFNYRPDYYYSNSPVTTGIAGSVGIQVKF